MLASEMVTVIDDHGFDDLADNVKLAALNDKYWEFCSLELWPFLEAEVTNINTVAGTKLLTTPSDLRAVLGLTNLTTGYPLDPERRATLTKRFASTLSVRGEPGFYYPIGSSINLMRVPDAIYNMQLDYLKRPAALTTPTTGGTDSSPIFPVDHHRLIVNGALALLNAQEQDPESALFFDNMYQGKIQRIRNDLWGWQYDRPDRIIDLFGNDAWDY